MADLYATPTGAGLLNGSSWANAFNFAALENHVENVALPNDFLWTRGGTYPLTGFFSTARDGTNLLPIHLVGVRPGTTAQPPTASDIAFGTDRPLFTSVGQRFEFDNYWNIRNIRLETDHAWGLRVDIGCVISDCSIVATGARGIYNLGDGLRVINTEVSNSGGAGIDSGSNCLRVIGCYIHNCLTDGVFHNAIATVLLNNIIETCGTGFDLSSRDFATIVGNNFYNNTLGIDGTDASNPEKLLIMNNNFYSNVVGVNWNANVGCNFWDWNNWFNNGTDVLNVTKGPNAMALDPQFANAAGGDFELIGRNLWGQGFGISLGVGNPSRPNVGPWQGRPAQVAVAGIDLSQDQLVLDGLEDVWLNGMLEQNAYRLDMTTKEGDPSYAAYLQTDVIWQLIPDGIIDPKVGDVIRDGNGDEFNILEVRKPFLNNYWNCITRKSAITTDTGLRDLITLYRTVISVDEYGSRIASHPTADPNFTDVPAKVQIQPAAILVAAGKQEFERMFDIYVDRDIDVEIGDLLLDQNAIWYDIESFDNRDRIDKLSHIVARYRD